MSDSERSRSTDRRSRRQFLRHALLTGVSAATLLPGLGLLAACGSPQPASQPTSPPPPAAAPTQANPFNAQPTTAPAAASAGSTKMTYWGGLIFSDAANNLFSQTVKDWASRTTSTSMSS